MSGVRRLLQVLWVLATLGLVVLHCVHQHPFRDAKQFATLLGLTALFIRAVLGAWRWADLAWRKFWLWLVNSSVRWTLEIRLAVVDPIEETDIAVLLTDLQSDTDIGRVSRALGSDTITIEPPTGYTATIRPMHSGDQACWVLRFSPVHIGYRDATHILQRSFVPLANAVKRHVSVQSAQYSIEARFSSLSPYAAVLLNELRARSADRILLSSSRTEAQFS